MSIAQLVSQNLRQLAQRVGAVKPPSYRIFDVQLKQRVALGPSLTRFIFTGPELDQCRTLAADQRIKLLFPTADGKPPALPLAASWHKASRTLPVEQRPPMRTYTIRRLRAERKEVDIEFVLHGETGPASRWATHAQPGERLQMVAPNALYSGDPGGYEWQPPSQPGNIVLIGDETALPAIAGILENLAQAQSNAQVEAFIEVPDKADCIELEVPANMRLHWFARHDQHLAHGDGMLRAAKDLVTLPAWSEREKSAKPLEEIDIEQQILWDLAKPTNNAFYAWVAGESGAVMKIRKHWVGELGIDRQACSFMGYWRMGRALE
jgi:NADPH-dependent ferric siderophore reductase